MTRLEAVRSALFLPASNPRAVAKARALPCDLAMLDLEDAVKPADKAAAREAAVAAARDWPADRLLAIRINGHGTAEQAADLDAIAGLPLAAIVIPKVEDSAELSAGLTSPVLAMIETPAGVYAARDIAAAPGVAGLIAGSNDLAADLRVSDRTGLMLALQTIVLAARAAGGIALDGVYNRLADEAGFAADCAAGRSDGFDGKTLIHPSQIEPCNRAFGPSEAEVEEARALVAAHTGGAERFADRMIEAMHVETARRVLARAGAA